MKKHFISAGIVLIMSVAFSMNAVAQCKGFVNQQINLLSPYVFSGTKNSTVLRPGDRSELALTFYAGQTYRLLMKSTETNSNVAFTVKDSKGNQVFKSNEEQKADYYDFTSETTQLYIVEISAPETTKAVEPGPSQCVVVMVGQKE